MGADRTRGLRLRGPRARSAEVSKVLRESVGREGDSEGPGPGALDGRVAVSYGRRSPGRAGHGRDRGAGAAEHVEQRRGEREPEAHGAPSHGGAGQAWQWLRVQETGAGSRGRRSEGRGGPAEPTKQ